MADFESVTIREVALRAGVSIATVSRVLNHHSSVTASTEQRVRSAMEELGYSRNEVARSLKVRQTRTIGIIAPELSNPYFMEVVEAMDRIIAAAGYTMIICSSNDSLAEEKRKLQVLIERNVDAVVVIPCSDQGGHFHAKALEGVPIVMVDRKVDGLDVDMVLTDNRGGVRSAMAALVAEGFKRVGFIGGDVRIYTARERLQGYLEAMETAGLPVERDFVLLNGVMNVAAGRQLIAHALSLPNHPEAFFIANNSLHVGATAYLMEHLSPERRERLVFASFDYLSYAPLLHFCHYAVSQPLDHIGHEVATLLLRRLAKDYGDYPKQIVLKPEIKVLTPPS